MAGEAAEQRSRRASEGDRFPGGACNYDGSRLARPRALRSAHTRALTTAGDMPIARRKQVPGAAGSGKGSLLRTVRSTRGLRWFRGRSNLDSSEACDDVDPQSRPRVNVSLLLASDLALRAHPNVIRAGSVIRDRLASQTFESVIAVDGRSVRLIARSTPVTRRHTSVSTLVAGSSSVGLVRQAVKRLL